MKMTQTLVIVNDFSEYVIKAPNINVPNFTWWIWFAFPTVLSIIIILLAFAHQNPKSQRVDWVICCWTNDAEKFLSFFLLFFFFFLFGKPIKAFSYYYSNICFYIQLEICTMRVDLLPYFMKGFVSFRQATYELHAIIFRGFSLIFFRVICRIN